MDSGSVRERVRLYVGQHPSLFFGIYSSRPKYRDLVVKRDTRLVIEGFPRSGNTFAVFAFKYAQGGDVSVAHHLHAPAQIMRAARWKIPALVLVREPMEAVLSLVLRDPRYSAELALRYYVTFYETIARYRDDFVLGPFEEVVRDYGAVIERVNSRFGTEFRPFEHTEENVVRIFSRIEEAHRAKRRNEVMEDQIAIPSDTKAELKAELKGRLWSPELEPLSVRAQNAYDRLILPGQ